MSCNIWHESAGIYLEICQTEGLQTKPDAINALRQVIREVISSFDQDVLLQLSKIS